MQIKIQAQPLPDIVADRQKRNRVQLLPIHAAHEMPSVDCLCIIMIRLTAC
jgi:hypothetical protein